MAEDSKPKKRYRTGPNLTIVLGTSFRERLNKLAAHEDRTVSYITRRALVEHLEKHGF